MPKKGEIMSRKNNKREPPQNWESTSNHCVNDISDEDYEDYDATGKTKFEVTGDIDLSFELYCRTDSIDVDLISDEKESDKGEAQNTTKEKKKLGENEVMVPESAFMYRGDKYQDVKNELQSLGF